MAFVTKVTSASAGGVEFEVEGQIAQLGNQNSGTSGLFFGFIAAAIVLFVVFGNWVLPGWLDRLLPRPRIEADRRPPGLAPVPEAGS